MRFFVDMQENREQPNYYAIIPASIRYDSNLNNGEKILYGEITALSNKTGVCYASNNYFARLYNVHPSTISRWISNLKKNNYIDVIYLKENKEIIHRALRLKGIALKKHLLQEEQGGYCINSKGNNTSDNNIDEYMKPEIFDCNWLERDEDED